MPSLNRKRLKDLPEWVKLLVIPGVLLVLGSMVGFGLGVWTERLKDLSADEKLAIDAKVAVYAATVENFSLYIAHSSRLRTIAKTERVINDQREKLREKATQASLAGGNAIQGRLQLDRLKARKTENDENVVWIGKRKEIYVTKRDDGRDKLSAQFDQARLNFGIPVVAAVEVFEKFELEQAQMTNLDEMATTDKWRRHSNTILYAMREEIRHAKQKRLS